MELYDYLTLLRQKIILVLVVVVVLTGGTYLLTKRQPVKWQVVTSMTIGKQNLARQENAPYYLFDNFYPLQSSGLVADMISNWLISPATVVEVYKKAGVALPPGSAKTLAKSFKSVQKNTRINVVDFTLEGQKPDELKKIAVAFGDLSKERLKALAQDDPNATYIVLVTEPAALEAPKPLFFNTLVALVISLVAASGLVYFLHYLKGGSERADN